jgi:hypothetical protein
MEKLSKVSGEPISGRSRKMLGRSVANLKKGLASAPIAKSKSGS